MMSFSFECLLKLKLHFIVCSFHSFSIFFVAVVQHMEEICNKFHFFCVGFNAFIPPKKHKKKKKLQRRMIFILYFLSFFRETNTSLLCWKIICSSLTNTVKSFAYDNSIWKFHSQNSFFFSFASCLVGFSL